ncbi:MAG: hypothetical protein AAF984_00390 [Verrucomicrobiota bacterium]
MKIKTANIWCCGILVWGFSAMIGHICKIPTLKGLGLASGIAPFTKVFCAAESIEDGCFFETFAANFYLHYQMPDGLEHELEITPEVYQKIKGPYNRRNVYGAVLAYGPALPADLQKQTLHYALLNPGIIPTELGLPTDASQFEICIQSRTAGFSNTWTLQP